MVAYRKSCSSIRTYLSLVEWAEDESCNSCGRVVIVIQAFHIDIKSESWPHFYLQNSISNAIGVCPKKTKFAQTGLQALALVQKTFCTSCQESWGIP